MRCRAVALADQLNLDFALINRKRRRDLSASITVPTVPPTPTVSESGSPADSDEEASAMDKMELLVGDVRGRTAILIDDMIDTGHTVGLAAGVLRDSGAKEVYALISHGMPNRCRWSDSLTNDAGLLSETTMENLKDLPVEKLIVSEPFHFLFGLSIVKVTNTIDQTDRIKACGGVLGIVDIAPLIAESIRRTHNG